MGSRFLFFASCVIRHHFSALKKFNRSCSHSPEGKPVKQTWPARYFATPPQREATSHHLNAAGTFLSPLIGDHPSRSGHLKCRLIISEVTSLFPPHHAGRIGCGGAYRSGFLRLFCGVSPLDHSTGLDSMAVTATNPCICAAAAECFPPRYAGAHWRGLPILISAVQSSNSWCGFWRP
jgi:hypothetical protein